MSDGMAGSIIMDAASLFFMVGILIYTALHRKRGRLDDRLFFASILVNMVLAAADGMTYLLEGRLFSGAAELMVVGNTLFYTAFGVFPYLFVLYLDYRAYHDVERIRKIKLPYAIPCFLLIILLLLNLKTGWIFMIDSGNFYRAGSWYNLIFVPAAFYFIALTLRVYKINPQLIFLDVLLIVMRVIWGLWFREISSTAFTFTLFLVCTHIYEMNRPLYEEKP